MPRCCVSSPFARGSRYTRQRIAICAVGVLGLLLLMVVIASYFITGFYSSSGATLLTSLDGHSDDGVWQGGCQPLGVPPSIDLAPTSAASSPLNRLVAVAVIGGAASVAVPPAFADAPLLCSLTDARVASIGVLTWADVLPRRLSYDGVFFTDTPSCSSSYAVACSLPQPLVVTGRIPDALVSTALTCTLTTPAAVSKRPPVTLHAGGVVLGAASYSVVDAASGITSSPPVCSPPSNAYLAALFATPPTPPFLLSSAYNATYNMSAINAAVAAAFPRATVCAPFAASSNGPWLCTSVSAFESVGWGSIFKFLLLAPLPFMLLISARTLRVRLQERLETLAIEEAAEDPNRRWGG